MKGKKARGPESELSVEAAARKEKLLALNRKWMSFVMICSDRGIFAWIESIDAADHVRSVCSLLWSAAVGNICLSRIKRCCRFMNVCYDGQQQWNFCVNRIRTMLQIFHFAMTSFVVEVLFGPCVCQLTDFTRDEVAAFSPNLAILHLQQLWTKHGPNLMMSLAWLCSKQP